MENDSIYKEMAEKNTILRAVIGSEMHGLNLEGGASDRDEMGVCIEPVEYVAGLNPFEQYEYRTAAIRDGKSDAKSQAGDLDLKIYSLRKFLRLALQGNPDVMALLFVKAENCVTLWAPGSHLKDMAPHIISRQAGKRYLGYMESQRQRLMGEIGQKKVNRPELEEKYGYDTKYAMHILRLGLQGVELLTTGRLTLPMSEQDRGYLKGVRVGKEPLQNVLTRAGEIEAELKDLLDTSPLPDQPNRALVEEWMVERYWEMWKSQRFMKLTLADGVH